MEVSRRQFLDFSAHAFMTVSLCRLLAGCKALPTLESESVALWLVKVNELARAVKGSEVTPLQWQKDMENLLGRINLNEFTRLIDFEALQKTVNLPFEGEFINRVDFKPQRGLPETLLFYKFITGFHKGRSIPPHGHDNLVSSFIVLKGNVHARHFERVRDDGNFIFVEPSLDEIFVPGQYSTVSDVKDNVHWFTALDESTFMFDFGVGTLDQHWVDKHPAISQTAPMNSQEAPSKKSTHGRTHNDARIFIDINKPGPRWNASFGVPRISRQEAYRIYG